MSVHLRATRDMQPTAMTYNEEEQSRLPQSRPRVGHPRLIFGEKRLAAAQQETGVLKCG